VSPLPGGGVSITRAALCAPFAVAITVTDSVTPEEGSVAWRTFSRARARNDSLAR
jgi:hypothetical protein